MGVYGAIMGAALILWPRQVLGLFTADPAVIEIGATYTRILGLCHAFMATEIVFENAFAGAGDTLPPMLISVPINVLRVPLVLWLVHGMGAGILGVGWMLSITSILRGLIAAVWFHRGRWKEKRL
jgi:Na+-driven multidrug efflux pump